MDRRTFLQTAVAAITGSLAIRGAVASGRRESVVTRLTPGEAELIRLMEGPRGRELLLTRPFTDDESMLVQVYIDLKREISAGRMRIA